MSLVMTYIDAPEGAQDHMSVSGNAGNSISNMALLASGSSDVPWATTEPGVWKLDGTRRIMPDAPEVAWWSRMPSDSAGLLSPAPVLRFSFSETYSTTGITLDFSESTGQWCSEIRSSWYRGQNLLLEGTYYPDSPSWVLEQSVEDFDGLQLELVRTNKPLQFAKLLKVAVGHTIVFGPGELIKAKVVNETDPDLCELTADMMTVNLIDKKGRNLIPQENQRVELSRDGNLFAVQYITGSSRQAKNVYTISAQSAIGLLTDLFLGGIYTQKPVPELLAEIFGDWPFELDPQFRTAKATGYIPACTQREALQQVAFAIGAVVSTQASPVIRLKPIPKAVSAVFKNSDIFVGGRVETKPRIAKVEIYAHNYAASSEEETVVQGETISGTDVLITFRDPHRDYIIEGGTITGSGANWITVTANGEVTVKAKKFKHNSVPFSLCNPMASKKEQGNIVSVKDATLINSGNVTAALERLYESSQMRQTAKQEAVIKGQKSGEMVSSVSPWGTQIQGMIASMDSTLTQNGHTAQVSIRGVEVGLGSVYHYAGKLFAGDREVLD